jgi:hypothetical protein
MNEEYIDKLWKVFIACDYEDQELNFYEAIREAMQKQREACWEAVETATWDYSTKEAILNAEVKA